MKQVISKHRMNIGIWGGFLLVSFMVFMLFSNGDFSVLLVRHRRKPSAERRVGGAEEADARANETPFLLDYRFFRCNRPTARS